MAENVRIVPASCTQCGGTVEVEPQSEKATCPFCGTSFIVEKAINNYNVQHANIEHADNVNIDMTGTVKTVLDFAGNQMKEIREERREYRREAAEKDRMMTKNFFKMFGIMFAVMIVFGIVAFVYYRVTDYMEADDNWDPEYIYSEDHTVSCYLDWDDLLSVNITDPGLYEWQYDDINSTERLKDEEADFDGYHFTIEPTHESGTGYAVVAEFDGEDMDETEPHSYGIVQFKIESDKITEITDVMHVDDLSSYSFTD